MKLTALLAAITVLTAMPVHAQTSDSASTSSAAPLPQSDALNALEDALWADIREGDTPYGRLTDAADGKADPVATCQDILAAHAAYNRAYYQFQGVMNGIDADTVLPADAKPGEKEAVNDLWDEIEYSLWDLEELGTTYNCPPPL